MSHLLADGTLPESAVAVEPEIGLEVEALEVPTVVAPGRKGDSFASDRTS